MEGMQEPGGRNCSRGHQRTAASWLVPGDLLSLLSCTTQGHLSRGGTTASIESVWQGLFMRLGLQEKLQQVPQGLAVLAEGPDCGGDPQGMSGKCAHRWEASSSVN